MAMDAYTIRIFVPTGDPDGLRIIDRMNWTGKALIFPRTEWKHICKRQEFTGVGVYILVGFAANETDDNALPTVYIGQGDGVDGRIDSHYEKKDFWETGIVFVSSNQGLNRAHITWLEWALIRQAQSAGRSQLDNGQTPSEPALTEAEKADTKSFLSEILRILPLANIQVFEKPRAVAEPNAVVPTAKTAMSVVQQRNSPLPTTAQRDTVIVPAQKDGFEKEYLGNNCWFSIRISGGMLDKLRYIAAYQTAPVSAITHVAPIERIEPYGEGGKYKLYFSAPAKPIGPIPLGDAKPGAMQGPRYTNYDTLMSAKKFSDLSI